MAPKAKQLSLVDPSILRPAILESFKKLAPQLVAKNPVMFVVEIGSILTTAIWLRDVLSPSPGQAPTWFTLAVAIWLWFPVLFANFAEAVAEGRGKAQAETLRRMRQDTVARKVRFWPPTDDVPGISNEDIITASRLKKGDLVIVDAGQIIPGDGEVIDGIASVDESAITGESAPVIRESGGDRSAVTGSTKVLSDRIVVRITVDPGESFLDRMIGLVEGASRQKTPNEIALHILLVGLTIVFLFACVTLVPMGLYSGIKLGATAVVALLVCLIPTTIGGLLSAIGIAGMDRLLRKNVLAMSGRAVEAAGDVDTLLLDKTGTITLGNRMATEIVPAAGGGTPLAVADGVRVLGLIHLKDVVKGGIAERFARFRAMGIRTVMITGDNPRTAAAIARESGVDDFLAQATPETKMQLIKDEQGKGKLRSEERRVGKESGSGGWG